MPSFAPLFAPRAAPAASLEEHLARAASPGAPPFDRAILGGAAADRVAYAFASGYQAALAALAPGEPPFGVASLCATEAHGAHPRDIATTLDLATRALSGEKRWATLSPLADALFVVAKTGERDGRNVLAVARLSARAPGVTIEPMPAPPFAPEAPHARIVFRGAVADAVLEGDGYERYVKPFRTLEDVHVLAALLAYVVAAGRAHAFPHELLEDALGALAALRGASLLAPDEPATHVALAGALRHARDVFEGADARFFASAGDPEAARWARDRPLLQVAEHARGKRIEAAWRRLEPPA